MSAMSIVYLFFFKHNTAYEMRISDWSSDVCSSDLFDADRKLSQKGFRAETQLAATEASLEAAEAAVKIAEVELSYTIIRAPFDGLVDLRLVELGDFVDRGDTIARLVDLDPMLIVTQVNERDVQSLTVGAPGKARLIGGLTVEGRIRHISSVEIGRAHV